MLLDGIYKASFSSREFNRLMSSSGAEAVPPTFAPLAELLKLIIWAIFGSWLR